MARKQERSHETTSAIIRAVMKLSLVKGMEEITVREICAEASVSVGAFYHHFTSREELIRRIFEYFDRELSQYIEHRCQDKTPLEALTEILIFQVRYMSHEGAGLISPYYRTLLLSPSPDAVSFDRPYFQAVYNCVQSLADAGQLSPDCSPRYAADLCILFVRGSLIDWCLHSQSYDIVARMRAVLPIFLRSFAVNHPQSSLLF